jgi:hypothetical protein
MANTTSIQILEDGPRNVIIKVEGVLDTSDVAATGTLGASASGATTINSPNITFTAGGLAPLVGQYVTGTGIPAGTYLVSSTATTGVLSANATATGSGLTFTLVAGNIVILDPAMLSQIDYATNLNCKKLAIRSILYNVEDLLSVNLFWANGAADAGTAQRIEELVGRGKQEYFKLQPIQNTLTTTTGRLLLATQGWASTTTLSFDFYMSLMKQ